jgi:membrane fusion protein (multidrug efflux system)
MPTALTTVTAMLAICALTGCGKAERPAPGEAPAMVTTVRVAPQVFHDTLQALGTTSAHESVTITAKVSETVQRVHFDSGDEVGKGAVLVTLSGQQQQAALAQAQAAAVEAERLYKRQSELASQQLIARSQLDSQRAARDSAQAQVAQVRAQLGDRVIRAPFAGVLGIRQVSPGALVTPGTPIATLDDLSSVYVDFPMPEAALAQVGPGQQVRGRSEVYGGRDFAGMVETVDARVDPATRAVTVRAAFANPDRALRPGMLVTVQVQRPQRQALLVPEIAVVQVGQTSFVYRVKDDATVEQARVVLGARSDGKVEIRQGLRGGDRIVVDGTGKLRPGAKIAEADAGAEAGAPAPPAAPARGD